LNRDQRQKVLKLFSPHEYTERRLRAAQPRPRRKFNNDLANHQELPTYVKVTAYVYIAACILFTIYTLAKHM
jgi:hypothetical protein